MSEIRPEMTGAPEEILPAGDAAVSQGAVIRQRSKRYKGDVPMSEIYPEMNETTEEMNEMIHEAEEMVEEILPTEEAVEEVAEEVAEEAYVDPNQCQKCGFLLGDDQQFCPKCGTQKGKNPALICTKCGSDLLPGQEFCTACGQKVATASALNKVFATLVEKYKGLNKIVKIAIPAVVAALLIVAIVLGAVAGNAGKDFRKLFPELTSKKWATFSRDGTWMRIDSNPNDVDDEDYYDYTTIIDANDAVSAANDKLGFPASTENKMSNTTWSMGPQTESTKKYMVTWTYHPDKGLEVLYEVIK